MEDRDGKPWQRDAESLEMWFYIYLAVWVPGALFVLFAFSNNSSTWFSVKIIEGSLFPYAAAILYAYRVKRSLHHAGQSLDEPWTVLAVALVLNPLTLGFVVPLWILRDVRRADRAEDAQPAGNEGTEQ